MSNKKFFLLTEVDKRIRMLFPTEMWDNDENIVTIKFFGGFELFNSRPYHNYESWSEGWNITTGPRFGNISVTSEDLDDALTILENKVKLYKAEKEKND
jgi:hypothetical protein